ncbi:hypothetical protein [Psychrobacillus vulpis]|uniref:Short-chain dehydrogenase n=1 Tax=Psychrobacillus vulpis TaxID=2325572 RepID=A0A544TW75_9BACI|nr:hypothetical protein [Psychrobacillus vulpis]TQR21700.1 hypothetical protein FG384_01725 [Psychrobacillus vulpis]
MKHICIIGGTGMLADVTKWYAESNYIVSVVARNVDKMKRMKKVCKNPEHIKSVFVDYRDSIRLAEALEQSIREYGPFSEVIAWVHHDGLDVIQTVFDLLEEKSIVWQVVGSTANVESLREQYNLPKEIQYRFVQLGFIRENNRRRWLSNEEIADGVIQSIRSGDSYNIIGEISIDSP